MASRTNRNIWRTKRLIIRPVETSDEEFLQSINGDSSDGYQNAAPFVPVPQGTASAKVYREVLEKSLIGCIICLPPPTTPETESATASKNDSPKKPTPIPIGTISLSASEAGMTHHRNTTLGIHLAPQYQGQGYGSAYNEDAWRLYERLGFVYEGRKREVLWYDGEYHDMFLGAMLRREWQERYGVKRDEQAA
jgi:RimJ/RimL family protein N-acetyltransferase